MISRKFVAEKFLNFYIMYTLHIVEITEIHSHTFWQNFVKATVLLKSWFHEIVFFWWENFAFSTLTVWKNKEKNISSKQLFKKTLLFFFICKNWFHGNLWQKNSWISTYYTLHTLWKLQKFTLTLFDKNFVKATVLLKSWFHELSLFGEREFPVFTLTVWKIFFCLNKKIFRKSNSLVKTLLSRNFCQKCEGPKSQQFPHCCDAVRHLLSLEKYCLKLSFGNFSNKTVNFTEFWRKGC